MKLPRTISLCLFGHRLVAPNLAEIAGETKCGRCWSPAFRRWYAQHRVDLIRRAGEAALVRIVDESETREQI